MYGNGMALSARNQLAGEVKNVHRGDVMAHVMVQVGENEIDLKPGDRVAVVIKSTEVMIQK
jgi:molybdopterin-binding protein